jgi:Protein of unknown function DUF262/Protein of unknown function (DUF1524)/MrcB-like, N-terminal domain
MHRGFFNEVTKFLFQAESDNLKTSDYPKFFDEFAVDVSFGKGRKANVPWISFLAPNVQTSNGYYPVYLYYRHHNKLILALGISEEKPWSENWPPTATDGLLKVNQVIDADEKLRYLDSWVYKEYRISHQGNGDFEISHGSSRLSPESFEEDLNGVLALYKSCLPDSPSGEKFGVKRSIPQKAKLEPLEMRDSPTLFELTGSRGPENTDALFDAIRHYRNLAIKDYQRTYQWTTSQLDELFADLFDSVESRESHFFGTLIIQQEEGSGIGTVVDGQQRLTSIFILAAALRDQVHGLEIREISSDSMFMMSIDVLKEIESFLFSSNSYNDQRFQSNRGIRPLLRDSVIAPPVLGGSLRKEIPSSVDALSQNFVKAVAYVRSVIASDIEHYVTREDKLKRVYLLFRAITQQFKVLKLVTNDLSESLEIFLTLNNRGLPLGPSDIVRGEIMAVMSRDLPDTDAEAMQSKILTEWEGVMELIDEPEVFLRHFLVSTLSEKIQKKRIVSKVTEQFKVKSLSSNEQKKLADEFWRRLQSAATIYGTIISPAPDLDVAYELQMLEQLSKSHRIILLSVLGTDMSIEERKELVRLVFVLTYRWVMANQNAQQLEDFFQKRCEDLRGGKGATFVCRLIEAKALEIVVKSIDYLTTEGDSSTITRVLLHAVHKNLHPKQEVISLDNKKYHLEHIAPKTPTDHWRAKLLSPTATGREYDALVRQAGNLLLLDKKLNIEAQQKPFSQKRDEHYASATFFAHTQDMMLMPDWDRHQIESRTLWLAEMFEIIWSVAPTSAKVVSFTQWADPRR